MTIRFLGNTSCVPDPGTDTSCVLVNDCLLLDTGWAPVLRMREAGVDPLNLRGVLFSHFHQDHYLGLVQVLFLLGLRLPRDAEEPRRRLLLGGPREHLESVTEAACNYLQWARFPELALQPDLRLLTPGAELAVEGLHFQVFAARHVSGTGAPEPALAYRVTETATGACLLFSGDTHPSLELAEAAAGAQVLIHDSAHSTPEQAAETARAAGVERLILTHISGAHAEELRCRAAALFAQVEVAGPDLVVELPSG